MELVLFLVGVGCIVAIVALVQTLRCSFHPHPRVYEPFSLSQQDLQSSVEDDLDTLNDLADKACATLGQIEDIHVSNNSAPDESEYSLPPEVQKRNSDKRTARAKQRFKDEKARHDVIECFEEEDPVLEKTLVAAEDKLHRVAKVLGFNARYLKQGVNTTTEKTEGFESHTQQQRAQKLHAAVQELSMRAAQQTTAVKALTQKGTDLQNGKMSQGDVDNGFAKATASPIPSSSSS